MHFIDKMVSPDERKRKFTDRQILKILILLQIFHISYRSSAIFLRNHGEYMEMIGIREIPSFQTLSRRARSLDLHTMNREITFLFTMDVDSLIVLDWIVTKGNLHDSRVSHDLIDAARNFSYILADSAYDTSGIYDYIFENTHALPVIDTNKRRGIRPERLTVNRKIGIDLRMNTDQCIP